MLRESYRSHSAAPGAAEDIGDSRQEIGRYRPLSNREDILWQLNYLPSSLRKPVDNNWVALPSNQISIHDVKGSIKSCPVFNPTSSAPSATCSYIKFAMQLATKATGDQVMKAFSKYERICKPQFGILRFK
jgi:hypothetical protein